jgi:hypothetical protein
MTRPNGQTLDAATCACTGSVFHERRANGAVNCGDEQNVRCVQVMSDAQNCGSCGHACPDGQPCFNGVCGCPNRLTACPGFGCVQTVADPNNCGQCRVACPGRSQFGICQNGACI